MRYRVLTRIVALLDLTFTITFLLIVILWGFFVLDKNGYNRTALQLIVVIVQWIIYVLVLFFCSLNIVADGRLLQATKKGAVPETAIELCKLWWVLSWICLGVGVLILLHNVFTKDGYFFVTLRNGKRQIQVTAFLDLLIFIVRGLSLYCVYKYKREMNSALQQTITMESIIPLTPEEEIDLQNLSQETCEYESLNRVKSPGTYDRPTSYNLSVSQC